MLCVWQLIVLSLNSCRYAIDHGPRPLGQEEIPLAAWLVCMTSKPGVVGLKPAKALCALPHVELVLMSMRRELQKTEVQ